MNRLSVESPRRYKRLERKDGVEIGVRETQFRCPVEGITDSPAGCMVAIRLGYIPTLNPAIAEEPTVEERIEPSDLI